MITPELTDKSDLNEYALIYVICYFLNNVATGKNTEQTIEIMCDFIEHGKIQSVEFYTDKYKKTFSIDDIYFINMLERMSGAQPYSAQFLQDEFGSNFEAEETANWFNPQNSSAVSPNDVPKAKQCLFFQTVRLISQAETVKSHIKNRLLNLVSKDSFLGESVYFDIKNYDNNDLLIQYVDSFLYDNIRDWENSPQDLLFTNLIDLGLYINSFDHQKSNLSMELIERGTNPLVVLFLYYHFGLNIYQKNKAGICAYDWLNENNWNVDGINSSNDFIDSELNRIKKIQLANACTQLPFGNKDNYLKQIEEWNNKASEKIKSAKTLSQNQKFLKLGAASLEKLNLDFFDFTYYTDDLLESDCILTRLDKELGKCIERSEHLKTVEFYSKSKFKIYKEINSNVLNKIIQENEELDFLYYNTHINYEQFIIISDSLIAKNINQKYKSHNLLSLAIMQKRWSEVDYLLANPKMKTFLEESWPEAPYTMIKKMPNFIDYFKKHTYLINMKNEDGNNILHICAKHHLNNVLAQIIAITPSKMIYDKNNEGHIFMNYIESNINTEPDKLQECVAFFNKMVLESSTIRVDENTNLDNKKTIKYKI